MPSAYEKIHDKLDELVKSQNKDFREMAESQADMRVDIGKIQGHLKSINGQCDMREGRIRRLEKSVGGLRDKVILGTGVLVTLAALANIVVAVLF